MIRKLRTLIGRPATLTATEAQQALAEGALLLDVRERNEWQTGHAPQAMHLALGQLEEHLAELPVDRLIVAVCRSGRRSAMAAAMLSRRGYRVANLTGGMNAWAAAGLPVIVDRNKPGHAT